MEQGHKGRIVLATVCLYATIAITVATAAPIADKPLFMGSTTKPNLLLSIDDSGSMDFEVLLNTNDGGLWWEYDYHSFVNDDGSLVFKGDRKYVYLFPNGYSSTYNGARMRDDSRPAIPPIKAYAFIRSSEYNNAYYDPNVTYEPWPSYGGFSFSNADPTAAPWDPVFNPTTFNINLTQPLNTSSPFWTFFLIDPYMVCDDFGTKFCSLGAQPYNYFPATYWMKDTSSTYTFTKLSDNSYELDASHNIIIEAESGTLTAPMQTYDSSERFAERASGAEYIGTPKGTDAMITPPTNAEAVYNFTKSGLVRIWVRRLMQDDTQDALWMNVQNTPATDISPDDVVIPGDWVNQDGQDWHKWWIGHNASPNRHDQAWQWELWATVTLTGSDQQLRIRNAEGGSLVDQILITDDLTLTPSGPVEYDSGNLVQVRNCSVPQKPQYYRDFMDYPTQFTGVDAIAPDGSCLKRYEIKPATSNYPSGRTYSQELQNFANWFTYYRRRHHAMRGGLAKSMEGMSGIRTGLLYVNETDPVVMEDFDTSKTTFLNKNYLGVQRGSTPLRSALDHTGKQFQRTDADAPITDSCQRNYALLFTDGYNNDLSYNGVGNSDQTSGAPFADAYDDTLADIAHYYYHTNLRPDLTAGEVPLDSRCGTSDAPDGLDCHANLHMNTFTVGLGTYGRIFGVTHHKVQDAYDNPPVWPNANVEKDLSQVDDLYHAAVNGRGEIFSAQNTAELANVLTQAIQSIIQESGSSSSAAVNSPSLTAESLAFTASFDSNQWSGEFKALNLDPATGDPTSEAWSASDLLNARDPGTRVILTHDGIDGVPFRWANLNNAQQDDLNTTPAGILDTNGPSRLAFIRGDRIHESTLFRGRAGVLGDIIHSNPVYVGAPEQSWPDTEAFGSTTKPYSEFKNSANGRTPVVYVGANDGMLHGFKATQTGGEELMAYIPSFVYSTAAGEGLHYLTDPDYNHHTYVDQPAAVADVFIDNGTGIQDWRTVLFGGLRGGGKGLFALDVTDPTQFTEGNAANIVLWEFSANDDPDLGNIIGKPSIAMMANGKWAVITGNGYNDDGEGLAKLFIIFIEEGTDGSWGASDYIKISTGAPGGLSTPAVVDLNGDKVADRIYAGDLNGNMWVFDVSSKLDNAWAIPYKQGKTPQPLFTAEISGTPQPITAAPTLMRNAEVVNDNTNAPNITILFGTGKYFSPGDPTSSTLHSFYGIWDSGTHSLNRTHLEPRNITTSGNFRNIGGNGINWSNKSGYYVDLPNTGERVITTPAVVQNVVFFNTIMPNPKRCESGGMGWLMSIDAATGLQPKLPAFDTNNDGLVDGDSIHGGQLLDIGMPSSSTFMDGIQIIATSDGGLADRAIIKGESSREGRLGWTEKFRHK